MRKINERQLISDINMLQPVDSEYLIEKYSEQAVENILLTGLAIINPQKKVSLSDYAYQLGNVKFRGK